MIDNKFAVIKFISRHKLLFGCLIAAWIIGMIFAVMLIGRNSHSKMRVQRMYPLIHPLQHNRLPPASSFKMVKALRYCNPPSDITLGQEGIAPHNGTLELVSVVIRHGDRSSMLPMRGHSLINCSFYDHPLLTNYMNTFKQINGSLNNLSIFSLMPLYPEEICMPSALSFIGVHQHLIIGEMLRKTYVDTHRLINEDWASGQIRVFSTLINRTYQSATAFLFSFLPNFDISKLRIVPSFDTWFCGFDSYCNCPVLNDLEMATDLKIDRMLMSHPNIEEILQKLNAIVYFNDSLFNITVPSNMFDCLINFLCHGSDLPCNADKTECATFDDIDKLFAFIELQINELLLDVTYKNACLLRMHGFLIHLVEEMKNHIAGQQFVPRFKLFSGHDSTIESLNVALGLKNAHMTPYASRIVFELYEVTSRNTKHHVLKVLYNGNDVTKDLSFCKLPFSESEGSQSSFLNGLCPFENFRKFVEEDFMEEIGASFEEACGN